MNTHELAEQLLKEPKQKVVASVDLSIGEEDNGIRAFGELYGLQHEGDGTVTLLFDSGYINVHIP